MRSVSARTLPLPNPSFSADRFFIFSGPQVFLKWNAPRYFIAFSTHLGCYTLLILTLIVLRWTLSKRNSQRNEAAAAGVHEASDDAMVHAFEDMTDKENPNFRYMI